MATRRQRALERRREAARDPRVAAASSDKVLFATAIGQAPHLRETCRDDDGVPDDEQIAIGLLIRAAAAAIVKTCPNLQVMDMVTRRMQMGIAEHVNEMVMEGRPLLGRLHS